MDPDAFLFDPTVPKTGDSWVGQAKVASTYVQIIIPVSMVRKDQNNVSNHYIWSHSFENNKIVKAPKAPAPSTWSYW